MMSALFVHLLLTLAVLRHEKRSEKNKSKATDMNELKKTNQPQVLRLYCPVFELDVVLNLLLGKGLCSLK